MKLFLREPAGASGEGGGVGVVDRGGGLRSGTEWGVVAIRTSGLGC